MLANEKGIIPYGWKSVNLFVSVYFEGIFVLFHSNSSIERKKCSLRGHRAISAVNLSQNVTIFKKICSAGMKVEKCLKHVRFGRDLQNFRRDNTLLENTQIS
jgi:hypothetical protein